VGSQKLGQVKAVTGGQLVKLRAAGETVGQPLTPARRSAAATSRDPAGRLTTAQP
jgi:hypothetical protein